MIGSYLLSARHPSTFGADFVLVLSNTALDLQLPSNPGDNVTKYPVICVSMFYISQDQSPHTIRCPHGDVPYHASRLAT